MPAISVGGIFAKKYRLEERLGEGKFKETWKATDLIMNREVALKIFKEQNTSMDRIIHEATLQTKLGKHKNIAEIYDAAVDAETNKAYISEEYISGCTLTKVLEKQGLIEDSMLLKIAKQIAEALDYAHRKRIIHRDLKTDNVFLKTNESGEFKIVLTDWGGSAESGSAAEKHGSILVRPPEAFDGKIDEKTDMYGLGTLLYKLAKGTCPFEGNSYTEIKQKIRNEEPPLLTHQNTRIFQSTKGIIMRLLNKDPRKRYTARQLKRKIWWHDNWKKLAVASGITLAAAPFLSLVGLFGTLHTIGTLKSITLPKYDLTVTYLNSKRLKYIESPHPLRRNTDCNMKIQMGNLLPDEIESYACWGDRIFAIIKKDIFAYSITSIGSNGTRYSQDRVTETPDQEKTDLQVSTSGNLLAYMIGRDIYVIRVDGKFERKVLENIDEYVWYTFKDQITYRKGNNIYITDTQEAPLAEQNARKIVEGTHPRWTDDGTYLFYLLKNENETSICVKECGHSDLITGTKKIPGWKFPVEKSVQQFFITRNSQVVADKFRLAYFNPEKRQIIVINQKLDKKIQANAYNLPDFQDIQQMAFNPDMDGILFSGKPVQEKDYELFYYNLAPIQLLRLTDNQEDDINPMLFRYKSLK